jgi:hypothetical protein
MGKKRNEGELLRPKKPGLLLLVGCCSHFTACSASCLLSASAATAAAAATTADAGNKDLGQCCMAVFSSISPRHREQDQLLVFAALKVMKELNCFFPYCLNGI